MRSESTIDGWDMNRVNMIAEVYKAAEDLSDWVVWASDTYGDGEVYVTTFSGPYAEHRALEYAALKFAGFQRHEPDQLPCQSNQSRSGRAFRSSSRGAILRLVE